MLRLIWLAALLSGGCSAPEHTAEAGDLQRSFPVAHPEVRTVTIAREYVSRIEAVRHAELHARIHGIVEAVGADEGAAVHAGQLLFSINARVREEDVAVARAATRAARAELHAAELDLANTQLLADKNIVSTAELERARSKTETLRAKVEEAQAQAKRATAELERADIRAPFDGVIDRIPRKVGSTVAEDELLTTISDPREVFAYFSISEREYLELVKSAAGDEPRTVQLVLADGSVFSHPGVLDAVAGEIDPHTGTLAYRARFPNPEHTLKHGSSGEIVLRSELPHALLVPQKATFDVQGNVFIYAVDPENVVHLRKLEVEQRLEDQFVIASGLAADERYLVEGLQQVKDGMTIVPHSPDPRS